MINGAVYYGLDFDKVMLFGKSKVFSNGDTFKVSKQYSTGFITSLSTDATQAMELTGVDSESYPYNSRESTRDVNTLITTDTNLVASTFDISIEDDNQVDAAGCTCYGAAALAVAEQ